MYLFQLRGTSSGGRDSRVGKDCLWNDELQRKIGRKRERERPEEAQTEAGKGNNFRWTSQ